MSGSATATLIRGTTTLEERLAEVEKRVGELRASLDARAAELAAKIDAVRSDLSSSIASNTAAVEQLRRKVEHAAVGGFKAQAFGVVLAIHGAVASVFA